MEETSAETTDIALETPPTGGGDGGDDDQEEVSTDVTVKPAATADEPAPEDVNDMIAVSAASDIPDHTQDVVLSPSGPLPDLIALRLSSCEKSFPDAPQPEAAAEDDVVSVPLPPSPKPPFPALTFNAQSFPSEPFTPDFVQMELICSWLFPITSEDEVRKWRKEIIKVAEDKSDKGWSLLHLAVGSKGSDDPDLYGPLLATGVDPDSQTKGGFSPAYVCAAFGRPQCLQLLVECRANMKERTKAGESPADKAKELEENAKQGLLDACHSTPAYISIFVALDFINQPGETSAETMPEEQKVNEFQTNISEVSRILVEATAEGRVPETLASLARRKRFFSVQNLIRRALFVLSPHEFKEVLDGKTAEEWAIEHQHPTIAAEIRFWARRAKNIDAAISVDKMLKHAHFGTPPKFERPMEVPLFLTGAWMHQAAMKQALLPYTTSPIISSEIFKELQKEIIEPYETELDISDGWTAIHNAVGNEGSHDEEALNMLLAMGINPDRPNRSLFRPSHHCATNGRATCIKVLIECRVDLDARIGNGRKPLELALLWQDKANQGEFPWSDKTGGYSGWSPNDKKFYPKRLSFVIELLLDAMARQVSRGGPESLSELACRGRFLSVQSLMRRPGKLDKHEFTERHNGLTAQQWAIEHGRLDVAAEMQFWNDFSEKTVHWSDQPFPKFKRPEHLPVSMLGDRRQWTELRVIIEPFVNRPVQSDEEDEELKKMQEMLDTEKLINGWAVVHDMLGNDGGDDPEMFGLFASLGTDLDMITCTEKRWTPLHLCALNARSEVLKILVDCRVDLYAQQNGFCTALALAAVWSRKAEVGQFPWTDEPERAFRNLTEEERLRYPEKILSAVEILNNALRKGRPDTIAQLAHRKAFPALLHVLRSRRNLVDFEEFSMPYQGKTAQEWAAACGRMDIAAEIDYRRKVAEMQSMKSGYGGSSRKEKTREGAPSDAQSMLDAFVMNPDIPLMVLGAHHHQHLLETCLGQYDHFAVSDQKSEANIKRIAKMLESSRDPRKSAIIHSFVSNEGSDNADLYARLLSLGVDPDAENNSGWRAVHLCSTNGRVKCLEQLFLCRADMEAPTTAKLNPLGLAQIWLDHARQGNYPWSGEKDGFDTWTMQDKANFSVNVEKILQKLRQWRGQNPPTLVQLAKDKHFFAIRHILRRGNLKIPKREFTELVDGRDAAQWAISHGRLDVADEISYKMKKLTEQTSQTAVHTPLNAEAQEFPLTPEMEEKASATLGQKDNWPQLRKLCEPLSINFSVVKAEHDQALRKFAERMDSLKQANGWRNAHDIVGNLGGDDDEVLGVYLSLGTDPEVQLPSGIRPLHLCVTQGRINCLKLLIQCRADIFARDCDGDTPKKLGLMKVEKKMVTKSAETEATIRELLKKLGKEQEKDAEEIVALLSSAEEAREPQSLAELARDQKMPALQHLIRRPKAQVQLSEYFDNSLGGRDVLEWALEAGRRDIALEIRYRRYKALAEYMESQDVCHGEAFGVQTGLLWDSQSAKRSWGLLMDFCAWLVTENQAYLTSNVKHKIEASLESWFQASGRSGTNWLHEWFGHIRCMSFPGPPRQKHDHGSLGKFISIADAVHLAGQEGTSCSQEAAWFIWTVLITQLMKTPPPPTSHHQGLLPQGKLLTWLRLPETHQKVHFLLGMFADLVDACWMSLCPEDWDVVENFFETLNEELEAAGLTKEELQSLLSSPHFQDLAAKLQRIGFTVPLTDSLQESTPEQIVNLAKSGDGSAALGLVRRVPFEFLGTDQDLDELASTCISKDGEVPPHHARMQRILAAVKKSIALQMHGLTRGKAAVQLAKDKQFHELQQLLDKHRVSALEASRDLDGKNAAEWCEFHDELKLSAELNVIRRGGVMKQLKGKTLAEHAKEKNWTFLDKVLSSELIKLKPADVLEILEGKNVLGWCAKGGKPDLAEKFKAFLPQTQRFVMSGSSGCSNYVLQEVLDLISASGKAAFYHPDEKGQNLIQQVMKPGYPFKEVRETVLREFQVRDASGFGDFMKVLTIDDALRLSDSYLASLVMSKMGDLNCDSCDMTLPLLSQLSEEEAGQREKFFWKEDAHKVEKPVGMLDSKEPPKQLKSPSLEFLEKLVGDNSRHIAFAQKCILPHPVLDLWVSCWWKTAGERKHGVSVAIFATCLLLAVTSIFSTSHRLIDDASCISHHWEQVTNQVSGQSTCSGFGKGEDHEVCSLSNSRNMGWLWVIYMAHLICFLMLTAWDIDHRIPPPLNAQGLSWQYLAWKTIHITAIICVPALSSWTEASAIIWNPVFLAMVICVPLGALLITDAVLPTEHCQKAMAFLDNLSDVVKLMFKLVIPVHALLLTGPLFIVNPSSFNSSSMIAYLESQANLNTGVKLAILLAVSAVFNRLIPGSKQKGKALQTEARAVFLYKHLKNSSQGSQSLLRRVQDFLASMKETCLKMMDTIKEPSFTAELMEQIWNHWTSLVDLLQAELRMEQKLPTGRLHNGQFRIQVHEELPAAITGGLHPTDNEEPDSLEDSLTTFHLDSTAYQEFAERFFAVKTVDADNLGKALEKVTADVHHLKHTLEASASILPGRNHESSIDSTERQDRFTSEVQVLRKQVVELAERTEKVGIDVQNMRREQAKYYKKAKAKKLLEDLTDGDGKESSVLEKLVKSAAFQAMEGSSGKGEQAMKELLAKLEKLQSGKKDTKEEKSDSSSPSGKAEYPVWDFNEDTLIN